MYLSEVDDHSDDDGCGGIGGEKLFCSYICVYVYEYHGTNFIAN